MNKVSLLLTWFSPTFKLFFVVLVFLVNLSSATKADPITGKNILEYRVSLQTENVRFREVLTQIEKQASVKFIYSSSIIDTRQRLSISVRNKRLEMVLKEIFDPLGINYSVTGDRIMLKGVIVDTPKQSIRLESLENTPSVSTQLDKNVSGRVTDKNGEPLPGVAVVVKNTSRGTITDINGEYTINVAETGPSSLIFSFVGFVSQEVAVDQQESITVALAVDEKSLEEVVVVGYGSVKKKDLTGSVVQITPDAYKSQPVQGISEMLRGNAPGVIVKTNGDGSTRIRIRGSNSLNGNNDPLYIVDGVPMGSYSPNDVESIEVLKDASATAIYGSRGANGVVIVTTKRGKKGAPSLEVVANTSLASYPRFYDLLNGPEFADYYNSYFGRNIDFDRNVNTDWQRVSTQTGVRQNYQATLSGGNESMKFYIGGNYIDNKGLIQNQDNKTYRLRTNLDFKLGSKFSGRVDVSASQSRSHGSEITGKGALFSALQWAPSVPVFDNNGEYVLTDPYGITTYLNPYYEVMEGNRNSFGTNVTANGYFAYEVLPGLKISAQPSVTKGISEDRNFTNAMLSSSRQSTADRSTSNSTTWQVTGLATYDKTIATKHNINTMLGAEAWKTEANGFSANAQGLAYDDLLWYNLGSATIKEISSSYSAAQLASFFARANYNFDSKYYVTFSMRADGSSKFKGDNQFSYFPSGAVSWVPTNEEFMKDISWLDHLKLRASYGITGSQAIGSYATIAALRNRRNWSWGSGSRVQGVELNAPVNRNLRWEETTQLDVGIDASFLNNWSFSLDFYNKLTDGLLTERQLPDYAGAGSILINLGKMRNKGVDASLTYIPFQSNDFQWKMTVNASRMINTVVSLGEIGEYFIPANDANFTGVQLEGSPLIVQERQPLGQMFGYRWLGLWKTDEADLAARYNQKPGDNKYLDKNGNFEYDNEDREVIGNFMPKFNWSYNTNLHWKNFDFNVLIEGTHGQDMYNYNRMVAGTVIGMSGSINLREAAENVWTPSNQNTMWSPNSSSALEKANSSKWIEKADWVKVRNISIGYTVPEHLLKRHSFRLTASVQNALTFTGYSGLDPEAAVNGGRSNDMYGGVEYGSYPSPRIYTLGLTYNFK